MGDKVFARYLNHLDRWGELRDRRLFDDMWTALRRVLRKELTRRDLWRLPPGYLGIYGSISWTDEALDDLVQDCYLFAIHERRRSLIAQTRVRPDIDGLIVRNVRNFLFETQRRCDPLGFRVFELLQLAVRKSVQGGSLRIVTGDRRIRNHTIMEFTTLHPPESPGSNTTSIERHAGTEDPETELPKAETFEEVALFWCDELLPELVTVRGSAVGSCIEHLQHLLGGLPARGIHRFRFGDLIDAVKSEARTRWTAISTRSLQNQDPVFGTVEHFGPAGDLTQRESYRALLDGLEQAVGTWQGRRATRTYLQRLLTFLCHHAAETENPGRLPSSRCMAEILHIPRDRFNGLFRILRDMTTDMVTERSTTMPPPGQLSAQLLGAHTLNGGPPR